jgi:hypothetical protein
MSSDFVLQASLDENVLELTEDKPVFLRRKALRKPGTEIRLVGHLRFSDRNFPGFLSNLLIMDAARTERLSNSRTVSSLDIRASSFNPDRLEASDPLLIHRCRIVHSSSANLCVLCGSILFALENKKPPLETGSSGGVKIN